MLIACLKTRYHFVTSTLVANYHLQLQSRHWPRGNHLKISFEKFNNANFTQCACVYQPSWSAALNTKAHQKNERCTRYGEFTHCYLEWLLWVVIWQQLPQLTAEFHLTKLWIHSRSQGLNILFLFVIYFDKKAVLLQKKFDRYSFDFSTVLCAIYSFQSI